MDLHCIDYGVEHRIGISQPQEELHRDSEKLCGSELHEEHLDQIHDEERHPTDDES